jgi:glycosyltransferase involved in cell wall biosynthesis
LFFGLIRPYKGLEDLVAAFGALPREAASDMTLTVVGETWEGWAAPLRSLADSPHADRVRVVNRYVTDSEAAFVFAEADVLVLPYRRASSSGPLHIAMSHGLKVIMYDLPALREAAQDYEGVEFVASADVDALREALARVASHPREHFAPVGSWKRTVEAYRCLVEATAR